MEEFVGRDQVLAQLADVFDQVRREGVGRLVFVRGRRQVGKSRLVEEFLRRSGGPSAFFTATSGRVASVERSAFVDTVATSTLEARDLFASGMNPTSWDAALSSIAPSTTAPSVVVIDEFPYLAAAEAEAEGALQTAWDRHLSRRPILLILVGSDLTMMQRLSEYGRPLYGRASLEVHLDPLNPADIAAITHTSPTEAFDAAIVTGGMPRLVQQWPRRGGLRTFLERQLSSSSTPLVITTERSLAAEFPPDAQARTVVEAVAGGAPTFSTVGRTTGIAGTSLARALALLSEKGVITIDRPLSTGSSRETRYRVTDPSMAFWFRFVAPSLPLIDRGRPELVVDRVLEQWPDYRGRAVEPLVRTSIERLLPDTRFADALLVGSWWERTAQIEVDLVGTSHATRPKRLEFVGSIKWRTRRPFSGDDARALQRSAEVVPGFDASTRLVGVSAAGFGSTRLDVQLGPADLLHAWQPRPSR